MGKPMGSGSFRAPPPQVPVKGPRDFLMAHRRPLPRARMKSVHDFLTAHPDLLSNLPQGSHDAYLRICAAVSHLKSRKATDFYIQTLRSMEKLSGNPLRPSILRGAVMLGARNWAMVQPYFKNVGALPETEESIEQWTLFALHLADWDIDVAVTFLEQTAQALETLGPGDLFFVWGELAAHAVQTERRASRAAKAYLEEVAADRGATSLPQWRFWLEQAARIAGASGSAAEAFVRQGTKVCALLTEQETERWVTAGLAECGTDDDLVGYFSGTHLKALETRDGLASGVVLQQRANSLSLLCEAFLGRPVKIRSNASLVGVRGFTGGAATDGRTIYLPDVLPSAGLFKLMALHQASLLEWDGWSGDSAEAVSYPMRIHQHADRILLNKFPGLLPEMKRLAGEGLPPSHSWELPHEARHRMPWWGDLLPELVRETEATIQRIVLKAEEESELPPEAIEALLAYMMAEGQREDRGLWQKLQEVFDNLEFASPDPEDLKESFKTFFYREWDTDLGDYKVDWCLVRQRIGKDEPNVFVEDVRKRLHGIITLIRRQFVRLKPEAFRRFRAQEMGDQLDWEALIPALVEMRSGSFLSDKIYIWRDKRIRDVAVLFLVDMSASTEERVNGHRVIDIEKEAMVLMAEALDSLGDPFAIFGFSSEGRFRVDLFAVKDFGEPYGERVQHRLGSLEPKQFTRLGAVLRHGVYKLDGVDALVKLMVVLTDGRPYDLEYGNLNYGIADTKKALQEARQHKIHPFIITCDKKGSEYMKRICPMTQSIVVPKVQHLPALLPAIYKRLTT